MNKKTQGENDNKNKETKRTTQAELSAAGFSISPCAKNTRVKSSVMITETC